MGDHHTDKFRELVGKHFSAGSSQKKSITHACFILPECNDKYRLLHSSR